MEVALSREQTDQWRCFLFLPAQGIHFHSKNISENKILSKKKESFLCLHTPHPERGHFYQSADFRK